MSRLLIITSISALHAGCGGVTGDEVLPVDSAPVGGAVEATGGGSSGAANTGGRASIGGSMAGAFELPEFVPYEAQPGDEVPPEGVPQRDTVCYEWWGQALRPLLPGTPVIAGMTDSSLYPGKDESFVEHSETCPVHLTFGCEQGFLSGTHATAVDGGRVYSAKCCYDLYPTDLVDCRQASCGLETDACDADRPCCARNDFGEGLYCGGTCVIDKLK